MGRVSRKRKIKSVDPFAKNRLADPRDARNGLAPGALSKKQRAKRKRRGGGDHDDGLGPDAPAGMRNMMMIASGSGGGDGFGGGAGAGAGGGKRKKGKGKNATAGKGAGSAMDGALGVERLPGEDFRSFSRRINAATGAKLAEIDKGGIRRASDRRKRYLEARKARKTGTNRTVVIGGGGASGGGRGGADSGAGVGAGAGAGAGAGKGHGSGGGAGATGDTTDGAFSGPYAGSQGVKKLAKGAERHPAEDRVDRFTFGEVVERPPTFTHKPKLSKKAVKLRAAQETERDDTDSDSDGGSGSDSDSGAEDGRRRAKKTRGDTRPPDELAARRAKFAKAQMEDLRERAQSMYAAMKRRKQAGAGGFAL